MDSSSLEVEPYDRPNASRLDSHEIFITKMRSAGWPYHAIAVRLLEDCGVRISVTGLHDFCKSRRIEKGGGKQPRASAPSNRRDGSQAEMPKQAIDQAEDDEWDLVVPKSLSTWKSRGEDRPPKRDS